MFRSRRPPTRFVKLRAPLLIDQSDRWGPGALQDFPQGAFLRLGDDQELSHGVQPDQDFQAPVGWEATSESGVYRKREVFAELLAGRGVIVIETLDGPMPCTLPCYLCANLDENGEPDPVDRWPRPAADFEADYQPI